MANLQKWGSYTIEAAVEERQALDSEGGGEFMKLVVGRNVVRVLPPESGKSTPFRVTHQHFVKTADGQWVFTCPRLEKRSYCPLCAHANDLRRSANPADRKQGTELFPRRRVFANVINRAEPDRGPVVLAFGKQIHEQLVMLRQDETVGGDYTHPLEGIDVIIERTGTGQFDTEYSVNLARRSTPLHPDAAVMDEWASALHNLDAYAEVPGEKEIHDKMVEFFGESPEPSGEAEPPPPVAPRAPRPAGARFNRPAGPAPTAARPARPAPPRRGRTAQDDVGVADAEFEDSNDAWGMGGREDS